MRSAKGNKKLLAKRVEFHTQGGFRFVRKDKKTDDVSLCVTIALDTFNRNVSSLL